MEPMLIEPMYDNKDLSRIFKVKETTLYQWLLDGKLARTKVCGSLRIRESEALKLIKDGPDAYDQAKADRCRKVGLSNGKRRQVKLDHVPQ
jgi:hypothetical protein